MMESKIYFSREETPFCLLSSKQQDRVSDQAQSSHYKRGDVIWSNKNSPNGQFLVISGAVRLRDDDRSETLAILQQGEWFGDLLELSGQFKAVASSTKVEVICWDPSLWRQLQVPAIQKFWSRLQSLYQSGEAFKPYPVSKFPFVSSANTAAACLTMATQYLQNPESLESVQRQLRRQNANNVVEVGEKIGLQVRQLQIGSWDDLQHLSFPLLLRLQSADWILAYAVRGNRLIVANPANPEKTCESYPQAVIEAGWKNKVWQVELTQTQEKFSLKWFLPAIWRYRNLLGEVLLASFILQLLGLATPILTQVIIDKATLHESLSTLDTMAIALLGVALFEALLGTLRLFIFTHTTNRLDLSLSAQLFSHLMRLPLSYFESRRVGDTVAREQELEKIRQFLTGTSLTVIIDSVFSIVYLALMYFTVFP
jgi:ABC transporter transmembrane region/Cyclic nucleotide-binding domain